MEEEEKKQTIDGTKLKELKFGVNTFEANGRKYFVEPQISSERFAKMQELEIELSFGFNYEHHFKNLRKLEENLNKSNFVDSAVLVRNMLTSIADIEERKHPVMWYCACFINREDEDRRGIDEKIFQDKIDDWNTEGIDYHSFFRLAINMVRGLKENYKEYIRSISQRKSTEAETK
jgi:hypothetical protein